MLHSIQNILKVYDTGDKPVLVRCNDLNDYVCKHNYGQKIAYKLFIEWIGHAFMKEFGVSVASRTLVRLKDEHVLGTANCQPVFFKSIPLFATQYLEEALEWSQFNLKDLKFIQNREDVAKIAFFDLWMANEDRNWNNFNLLTNPVSEGWKIVPIDHGACLNSLSFHEDRALVQLSNNETLIDTDEFRLIVKPLLKNMKHVDEFVERLYLRFPHLEKIYDEQVIDMPSEWNIPKSYIVALKENLFRDDWLNETKSVFLSLIKSSLKLK